MVSIPKICKIDNKYCLGKYTFGYCKRHYDSLKLHGNTYTIEKNIELRSGTCIVDGCGIKWQRGKFAHGMCQKHYTKLNKYGDPTYSYYHQRPHIDCGEYIKIPTNIPDKYLLLDNDMKHVDDRLWCIDNVGYPTSRSMRAHVLVMGRQKKGFEIDHINRDKLDNRRSNLRVVTKAQNIYNSKPRSSSGYKGVSKSGNVWRAYYKPYGSGQIHIGCYKTPEEAAKAYDKVAKETWGEFAYLNFPEA